MLYLKLALEKQFFSVAKIIVGGKGVPAMIMQLFFSKEEQIIKVKAY